MRGPWEGSAEGAVVLVLKGVTVQSWANTQKQGGRPTGGAKPHSDARAAEAKGPEPCHSWEIWEGFPGEVTQKKSVQE